MPNSCPSKQTKNNLWLLEMMKTIQNLKSESNKEKETQKTTPAEMKIELKILITLLGK